MRREVPADGYQRLGAHQVKLVEEHLDVVEELQVRAVDHSHLVQAGERLVVEWGDVEKFGGILCLAGSPACVL